MRDKFRSVVRCTMTGDTMLGENIEDEEFGELRGCDRVDHQDEYTLLRKTVNNYKNRSVPERGRKLFNKIHRDGIPGSGGYRELLEESVGLVARSLGALTRSARVTIVLDESSHPGPYVLAADQFQGLILTKVSR